MKKAIITFAWILVAVGCGFALGRATAPAPAPVDTEPKKEYAAPPAPPKMEPQVLALVLETPTDGARVEGEALEVSGRAKAGPSPVSITLKTSAGETLASVSAPVESERGAEFGRFAASLTPVPVPTGPVVLEVARDGGTDAPIVRVVSFGTHDAVAMRAFFTTVDIEGSATCGTVTPLARAATVAGGVYRAALDELLKGPTAEEAASGHATAIPKDTTLRSVAANADGVVSVDLSSSGYRALSPCAREAARSQIVATIRQFPEARDVIITIDGVRTDIIDLQ